MNFENRIRTAFHCQPAQHLLIDVGYPMTPEILKFVIEAAENVISLASSLYGGVRVPEFGLSSINMNYCNILPFVQVRGNYPKIAKSFKFLENMVISNEKNTIQNFIDNLKLAIQKILEEHTSKQNVHIGGKEKLSSQFVLITIITLKDGCKIQNCMEEIINTLSTEKLKKIHILQIKESTINSTKSGVLIDLTQIPLNNYILELFFKNWLLDCDASQEHVCIHLNNCNRKDAAISIKCDVLDCMINPFLLPFGHFYQIQTDYFKGSGVIKFPAKNIPVYDLNIIRRISGGGLCESFLFGQPQRLSPTKCWQIEGEDCVMNMQYFYALCEHLLEKNEYLLAVSPHSEDNISIPGHYILIPGNKTLLLRAIAPSELILPNNKSDVLFIDNASQEITDNVDLAFSKIPLMDDFTSEILSSNLYHNLKNNFIKKSLSHEESQMVSSKVDHPALDLHSTKLCLTKKRRLY